MKKLLPFSSLLVVLSLIACLTKEVPQMLSSETFELTSKDGDCYRITLDRLYGNSIVFKKEKILCGEDAQNYRGIYDARATLIAQSEEGDGKYWYIPIDGDPQEVPGNPRIECFCEKQGNDEWGDVMVRVNVH